MQRSEKCEEFLKSNEVNCCTTPEESSESGDFNHSGCDCCDSLACNTHECHGYNPASKAVVELGSVCHECLCYFANGDDGEIE